METKTEDLFPTLTTIGIDIGNDLFHIVASILTARSPCDASSQRLSRFALLTLLSETSRRGVAAVLFWITHRYTLP